MFRRAFILLLAAAPVIAGCGAESGTGPNGLVHLVTAPIEDTILSRPVTPLTIQVWGHPGTPVVFRASNAVSPSGGAFASLYFARSLDDPSFRLEDTITTNAEGKASTFLRLSIFATDAVVTVLAPMVNDSLQVHVTVRPGTFTSLVIVPSDTAVYVGRHFQVQAYLVDARGNRGPATPTFTTTSSAITVTPAGEVTSVAIGRGTITAQAGGRTGTAGVSVPPEGRIAASRLRVSSDTSYIVLVNLDGSDYRSFPLDVYDFSVAAWHPDGSYLIASLRPPGSGINGISRLSALDTASGAWQALAAVPGILKDGAAEFSRDGMWVYRAAISNGFFATFGAAVYRTRTDGSGAAEQVGYEASPYVGYDFPTVSPDGQRVAMTVDRNGGHIQIVPATPPLGPVPNEVTHLTPLPTGNFARWSPVADELLMFGDAGMWIMPAGASSVSSRRYLAQAWTTGGSRGGSWSKDGKWIIAKAATSLILVEVATGQVLPLPFGSRLSYPAWRP